jgi:hypothetical protein
MDFQKSATTYGTMKSMGETSKILGHVDNLS